MEHVYAWFEADLWFWLWRLPLTLFWPTFLFIFKDNTRKQEASVPFIVMSVVPAFNWVTFLVCLAFIIEENDVPKWDKDRRYNRYQYVDWLWNNKTEAVHFLPLLALFSLFWI